MDKPKCGAKARSTGEPCKRSPAPGATRCRLHGGASPQAKAKAQLRLVEQQARELFGHVAPDIVPVDNPLAAYAEFAGRVMAWMKLMDSLLDQARSVEVTNAAQGEQARAAVQLYERAMDRTNTVLASYARLNIDSRLAAITEQQARTVTRAIEAVITHLGATGDRATEARALAARHLRTVA